MDLRRFSSGRWLRQGLETYVSLPLFTLLLLGVIWSATFHYIDNERRDAQQAARDAAVELLDVYEVQVLRNLQVIDRSLKIIKYTVERMGAAGALDELDRQGLLPPALVFAVAITDASGRVVASNPRSGTQSVAEHPYFSIHREHRRDLPFVAVPIRDSARADWHVHITRRLDDAQGRFAGIVIVEVDPTYFTSGYERTRQGQHGLLALVGSDGTAHSIRIGDHISWGKRFDLAAWTHPAVQPWTSTLDGTRRYTAARTVRPFGLVAVAGLAEDEQMAGFEQQRRTLLREAGIASAVLILLMALVWVWSWQGAKARRRVRRAQETYAAASEASMDAFFVLRAIRDKAGKVSDFRIVSVNSRAEQMTGRSRQALLGRILCDWVPALRDTALFGKLCEIAAGGGVWQGEGANELEALQPEWLHWQLVGVEDGVVAIMHDISVRKRDEARILHLAHHDTLTGLPNRSLIGDRLAQALRRADRERQQLVLAYIDLDGFKKVNDSLGHAAGDELLRVVAARMTGCVRKSDTVGRLGGDEFVLILPQQGGSGADAGAAVVLDKVLAALAETIMLGGTAARVGGSIGAALYPRDGSDGAALMMRADAAMYHAKKLGKNNIQFYRDGMASD
jgi:diguanylate cyclase (GGDEF)-like protein